MVDGNRGLHATVNEWVSTALAGIERQQAMIRDQGFDVDSE
jgi:hypothetical protein